MHLLAAIALLTGCTIVNAVVWVPYGNSEYLYKAQCLSWEDARAFCQAYGNGVTLASVHSAEENAFLVSQSGVDFAWIGGFIDHWIDGSPGDYIATIHPNDNRPINRNCLQLRKDGDWQFGSCRAENHFICKRPGASCGDGFYQPNGGVCTPISPACDGINSYESAAPTASSDRICLPVAVCDGINNYETVPPNPSSNRVCSPVTACAAYEHQSVPPSASSNRVCEANMLTISGIVKDSVSASVRAGAVVAIQGTSVVGTTTATGAYSFSNIPARAAAYTVIADLDGYYTVSAQVTLTSANVVLGLQMSTILVPGQYRIVTSWGSSPNDVDNHVVTPWGCEAYYSVKTCTNGDHAVNHNRDTSSGGFGPETITITESNGAGAIYRHFVYRYTTAAVFTSDMRVAVYNSNGLLSQIYVGAITPQWRFWHTFSLDTATGAVSVVNQVTCDPSLSGGLGVGESSAGRNC